MEVESLLAVWQEGSSLFASWNEGKKNGVRILRTCIIPWETLHAEVLDLLLLAGEYPSTLKEAAPEVHVTGDFAPKDLKGKLIEGGDPTGLYHLIFGGGQNAFVANGKLAARIRADYVNVVVSKAWGEPAS